MGYTVTIMMNMRYYLFSAEASLYDEGELWDTLLQ